MCSSPTSRCPAWTRPSVGRSSRCCSSCGRTSASPSSWSLTTWAWPGTSPTGSRSCTSAGSSRSARPKRCWPRRSSRTRARCCRSSPRSSSSSRSSSRARPPTRPGSHPAAASIHAVRRSCSARPPQPVWTATAVPSSCPCWRPPVTTARPAGSPVGWRPPDGLSVPADGRHMARLALSLLTRESVAVESERVAAVDLSSGSASPRSLQPALPKAMYVDPVRFGKERDLVLFDSWFCVGRVDDLGLDSPGRLAVLDVVGESILVTSSSDTTLHGAYNVCRHRGSQVVPTESGAAPPPCDIGALRCPYHSWTYDLDGRLLRAPHTEGVTGFDQAQFNLHAVGVGSWGGF